MTKKFAIATCLLFITKENLTIKLKQYITRPVFFMMTMLHSGPRSLNNNSYVFVNYGRSYDSAKNRCGRDEMSLVTIGSIEEFEYINSFMTSTS